MFFSEGWNHEGTPLASGGILPERILTDLHLVRPSPNAGVFSFER
ncbi:MAG TPA: hypothetical protein VMT52_17810 [Planctomycetota bacterium]|nr:hypothetical protein [Planctomycetota bacterium]